MGTQIFGAVVFSVLLFLSILAVLRLEEICIYYECADWERVLVIVVPFNILMLGMKDLIIRLGSRSQRKIDEKNKDGK